MRKDTASSTRENTSQSDKPKRGRPFTLPPDTRLRAMRLTDAEFEKVKWLVAKLRQGGKSKARRKQTLRCDMSDDLATLRAELERLNAEMTPGEWEAEDRRGAALKNIRVVSGRHDVCEVSDVHQRDYQGSFRGDHKAADAVDAVGLANGSGIAALRNALPRIIAVLTRAESAERRIELARQALIATNYFRPEEVGDDIAPRIAELHAEITAQQRLAALLAAQPGAAPATGGEFRVWTTTGPMLIAAKSQEEADAIAVKDGHRLLPNVC